MKSESKLKPLLCRIGIHTQWKGEYTGWADANLPVTDNLGGRWLTPTGNRVTCRKCGTVLEEDEKA